MILTLSITIREAVIIVLFLVFFLNPRCGPLLSPGGAEQWVCPRLYTMLEMSFLRVPSCDMARIRGQRLGPVIAIRRNLKNTRLAWAVHVNPFFAATC